MQNQNEEQKSAIKSSEMHHLFLISMVIILLSFRIHLTLANTSMRIKKCCPEHQQLYLDDSDNLKCGNVEDKQQVQNVNSGELYRESNDKRANTMKHSGGDKCENDRPQDNKTNGDNEKFDKICAKESNEVKHETIDTNNNAIWWIPNDLKFIRTNNDGDTNTIIENLNINRDSFIFNQPIPCFNQEPEFLLIEDNIFIDVDKSELVLSELEKVPEYKVEEKNIENQLNEATSKMNSQKDILNDTQPQSENEENWKISTKRNEVRKQGFQNDVNLVTGDSYKVKKQYGSSPKKITSKFHSDDFCIDRIVFKTDVAADDDRILDDDIGDVGGLPRANDTSNTSPGHLDHKDTNPSNTNDVNTEDAINDNYNDGSYVILLCPCQGKSSRNVGTSHYIVHATPLCSHGSYLLRNTHTTSPTHSNTTSQNYKIMVNSSVLLTSSQYLLSSSEYCIDSIYYANSGRTSDGNILLCRPARVRETSSLRRLVYTSCFIVGTTFLVLTLGVYAMLSELRKSVHSWNIISHVACSIVAYVGIVVVNLYDVQYPALCVLLAYVIQTSFLSSQLWLNVMCIDIAFTFSGLRAPRGSNFSSMDRRKYFYYSCYTWGTTACIAGLTALIDQTSILSATNPLKPNFGVNSCWFKESTSLAVLFYGPIGFLLLANLALFHYTCWKIRTAQKETAITTAHRHVGGRTEDQTRLATFLKLFLLMGVTWSFELLSWSLGGPRYLWYLTDLLNVLRGVFIFIILCCKRHVISLLKKRIQDGHRTLTRRPGGYRPRAESTLSRKYSKSSITTEQMVLSRLNLHSTTHSRILEQEEGKRDLPPPLMILGSVQEEGRGS
uniref:Probable G-protein coupled receptor Mth-like 1 n=1 Tax=Cacopsylla melanoneura TaxID=428564 RepID=A0A8D8XZM5_9HEMI